MVKRPTMRMGEARGMNNGRVLRLEKEDSKKEGRKYSGLRIRGLYNTLEIKELI